MGDGTTAGMVVDFEDGGQEKMLDPSGFPVSLTPDGPIDAESNPDAFNKATAAALSSSEPTETFHIEGPPDGSVRLLAGYVDQDGARSTSAEVRELRGRDEELIAKAQATGDLSRYVDTIIRCGTVRLGEVEDPKELAKALDTLLVGDRELLLLQIRRVTYGDKMRLDLRCPHCQAEFSVDYSFSEDVPIKPWLVDDPAERQFEVMLPSGKLAVCRRTDGAVQKRVYAPENDRKTNAEANTLLMTELLVSLDGRPVRGPGPVLDLSSRDRKALTDWINDGQPGPAFSDVRQTCEECARDFGLPVGVEAMFRGD